MAHSSPIVSADRTREEEVGVVRSLRRTGQMSGILLACYGASLLGGALYINELYKRQDELPVIAPARPVIARAMMPKLSFSIFPGFAVAWASYMILIGAGKLDGSRKLDHLRATAVQHAAKTLVDRANVGRLMVNVFAVVSPETA
jgi:hypothetical protein